MLDLASPPLSVTALAIGERAHAALHACGGMLDAVAGFEDAPYRLAGGQLVWLGAAARPRAVHHPRAIILTALPPEGALRVRLAMPWPAPSRRPRLRPGDATAEKLAAAAEILLPRMSALSGARGLGKTLLGGAADFPLGAVQDEACGFALACGGGDWARAYAVGRKLLGVGTGLTPSGDDYVGGVLYALRLGARGDRAAEVERFANRLCAAAPARTHVISATLLADVAQLRGYSVLDDLGLAAMDGSAARLVTAARALVALGQSSGWDLLTGFIAGAAGRLAAPAASAAPAAKPAQAAKPARKRK